jgi:uncharacterized protein (TIGR03067 family)
MKTKSLSLVLMAMVFSVGAWAQEPPKPDAPQSDAVKEEMQKLQGTWQVSKSIAPDGIAEPDEANKNVVFEFKDDRMIYREKNDEHANTYTLDSSKQPKWINIDPSQGADRMAAGIYKLEGDELTLCVGPAARDGKPVPRPTEFKPNKENGQGLLVLKRVKNP